MITPHLKNSINPLPWRYGLFLIALVCLALSPTANSLSAGTGTSRSGLVTSRHPSSSPLSAQELQEDASKAPKSVIITFDAPGAGTVSSPVCAPYCGTFVTFANAENNQGAIVGFYTDTNIVPHGFLRTPNGHIISFDAPGAGLGFGLNQGTVAYGINPAGVIAGQFQDSSYVFHAFVRFPDGSFTTFDAPGADTVSSPACAPFCGTIGLAISPAGDITGYFVDANNLTHGFLRDHDGIFSTFDGPGAGPFGTVPEGINPAGEITGFFYDSNNVAHGFLRDHSAITVFDPPGSTNTFAESINPEGAIVGGYYDANNSFHGFQRDRNGVFTILNVAGAGTGAIQGTFVRCINPSGEIAGLYVDANNVGHNFVRAHDGVFTTFDVPGTGAFSLNTAPEAINPAGEITGFFYDNNNVGHGFLRSP